MTTEKIVPPAKKTKTKKQETLVFVVRRNQHGRSLNIIQHYYLVLHGHCLSHLSYHCSSDKSCWRSVWKNMNECNLLNNNNNKYNVLVLSYIIIIIIIIYII